MTWNMTVKPALLTQVLAVAQGDAPKVLEAVDGLMKDPRPDGHWKKKLKGAKGEALYRLRVGRVRVLYSFDDSFVSVLGVRLRDERTYTGELRGEQLGGRAVDDDLEEDVWQSGDGTGPDRWIHQPVPAAVEPLPRAIDEGLLGQLRIPKGSWAALLRVRTEEDLLGAPVSPAHIEAVVDAIYGRPLEEAAAQPDLVVEDAGDLIRYREGGLLGFLLRLSPAQERFVGWAMNAKGPTLLKGGPGTGKSTVALRRVPVFLEALRKAGVASPRVLFTTYTRALTRVSEQLLGQILKPEDRPAVEVATADTVAMRLYRHATGGDRPTFLPVNQRRRLMEECRETAVLEGNALELASQRRTLERLGPSYLWEEITGVIEGRGLTRLEAYLTAPRPGRREPLGAMQRRAVWAVRERMRTLLEERGLAIWEDVRNLALAHAGAHPEAVRYDAVLVDEAQDLQPVALRLLVTVCGAPERLFLTADANQSIYGGAFRWADVHEGLRFTGRTGTLRGNFRSTREIARAARQVLAGGGGLDEELDEEAFHSGPLPVARKVAETSDEAELLVRFIRGASRELRLATGSAAVLCPSNDAARRIAEALRGRDLAAQYAKPGEIDLTAPGVKVLTLKSAKGLEFPIVALAGFLDGPFPALPKDLPEEARAEATDRERRTLYVAMTRAMRALLVVAAEGRPSPLLEGFDPGLWNLGR
jgi:superfamily I DNA/RNA helicase/mRNA-degrading endonuclease RelE of RelBE toxin-antitoxin system